MRYALVTPARDEAPNLRRLAESVAAQTVAPAAWVIADNGSTDGTAALARSIAEELPSVSVIELAEDSALARGGPIVRAFHAGLEALTERAEVIVKVDADLSFDPDYFGRLLAAFEAEPRLGIASGSAWELEDGVWKQQFMTGESAWGAARAYRRECLDEVLPLEERIGWDTVDAVKASLADWRTRTLGELRFRHHRPEGERDGRGRAWDALGRCASFLGYRPSYQVVRTLHQLRHDPWAIRLMTGYVSASLAREPRCDDPRVVDHLREQQRLRRLLARRREALGRTLSVDHAR